MELGVFSVSLSVKDIDLSEAFYTKLGFSKVGGDITQNWLIMRNGETTIGIFQGMFEKNMMTFNPGWDAQCKELTEFSDVRDIQKDLKAKGIEFEMQADEDTKGPASFIIKDPDGNPILLDQHL